MSKFKVLLPQSVAKEGIHYLEDAGCEIIRPGGIEEQELMQAVKGCDAILIRTAKISRAVIESADKLKVIARHGVGLDNVDIEAASEKGIYVCNAPTANINSVAEHVVGLMLSVSHFLTAADKALRQGDFQARNRLIGNELLDKTVGLIGCGNIGRLVAQKCALGMGMKVITYDPHAGKLDQDYIEKVDSMEELLKQADYVSLHVPYLPELHHVIDAEKLKMMKPSAYLINAARGGLVDEEALIQTMNANLIAGAALDCFEEEPPPADHPFWQMENVVVTPHMAAHSKEAMVRMALTPAEEIVRVKNGQEPKVWVNRGQIHGGGIRQ